MTSRFAATTTALTDVDEIVVVIYDIADARRLQRVAKLCRAYGHRVQKSVFEMRLRPGQIEKLQAEMRTLIDVHTDRVRYYRICGNDYPDIALEGIATVVEHPPYHVA